MGLELAQFYNVVNFCSWFSADCALAVIEFSDSLADRIGGVGFFFRQGMLGTPSGTRKRKIMAGMIHWGF